MKRRRPCDAEPEDLLARALEGVEPLRERPRVSARGPVRPRAQEPGAPEFDVTSDGEAIEGRVRDLARRALRRLRGLDPADTLDLHGLGAEEARSRLEAFVRRSADAGHRAVLVVHGKGAHSEGDPVLKGEIASWLTAGTTGSRVLAFATAPGRLGGTGALMIFLRREVAANR
ncbi:MAG: Smr/MutS family protein [Deltaproteobacteria bacterium]|nr:Smr/MutS family protein [Deltaproteobacteria bacterium]